MKIKQAFVATTAIAALGLSGCSTDAGDSEANDITLRATIPFGPESRHTSTMETFAEAVTDRTDGSVEFDFYYGDALVSPDETPEALRSGTVDMAFTMLSLSPDAFTIDNWIAPGLSAGHPSPDAGTLQKAAASLEWSTNNDDYLQEFEDNGVYPLVPRLVAHDIYGVYCNDPVTSLDEASGQRVRVGGSSWAEEVRALDMVPVTMASTETYTSLQQGVIDCFMGSLDDVDNLGLADLGGHFTDIRTTGYDSIAVLLADQTWEQLTDDQQQAMQEESATYLENYFDAYRDSALNFVNEIEESGEVTLHEADSDLLEAVGEFQQDRLANLADSAPDTVTDGQQAVDDYTSTYDKWLTDVEDAGYSTDDESWLDFYDRVGTEPESVSEWAESVREQVLDDYYGADQ